MRALAALVAAGSVLWGCSESYEPPDTAVALGHNAPGSVVATEEILATVRFLSRGGANAELNTAKCTMRQGRQAIQITPPVKVSVRVPEGPVPPIALECEARVGPSLLSGSQVFQPATAAAVAGETDERHYPQGIRLFLTRAK